jgi:Flp pilus assembly protein TadD
MRLGQLDQGSAALEEFRRLQAAAQSASDEEWALKLLKQSAQASLDTGDLDGATAALEKVAARQPGNAANHVNLGIALERAGRYDRAIDEYRAALALDADANVHGRLATAYRALGRERESEGEQLLYERSKQDRFRGRGFAR